MNMADEKRYTHFIAVDFGTAGCAVGINYNKRTKGRLIFRGAKTFFIDNRYRVRLLFAAKYKMSILDLGPVIFSSIEEQIEWFQRHNLLATRRECPACHVDMEMQLRSDIQDKYR